LFSNHYIELPFIPPAQGAGPETPQGGALFGMLGPYRLSGLERHRRKHVGFQRISAPPALTGSQKQVI
jgi:hypothetical protein